jgi:hypothetical protein
LKKNPVNLINFTKEGQSMINTNKSVGILNTADDWKMEINLKRRAIFPKKIFVTNQRPDIVILYQRRL